MQPAVLVARLMPWPLLLQVASADEDECWRTSRSATFQEPGATVWCRTSNWSSLSVPAQGVQAVLGTRLPPSLTPASPSGRKRGSVASVAGFRPGGSKRG